MIDNCLTLKATLYDSGQEPLLVDIGPFESKADSDKWISRFWEALDLLKKQIGSPLSDRLITQLTPEVVPSSLSDHEVPLSIWEALDEIEHYYRRVLASA